MRKYILDFKEHLDNISFTVENKVFCNCGNIFEISPEEKHESINESELGDDDQELKDLAKMIKVSNSENEIICSSCQKNYSQLKNVGHLISEHNYFLSGFEVSNTDEFLYLYYVKIAPYFNEKENIIEFDEKIKYLKLDKKKKKTFILLYDEEVEFSLDEVVKYIDLFFKQDLSFIINLVNLHMFINHLTKEVIDSKNINIINDILEKISNRANYAGLDEIKKITTIFFGMIQYSNLSTIGLTKGSVFLYDMMVNCELPKPEILSENQITSPIKIFNFLIKNYIKKLNEEVNEDNKTIHEFVYKSKEQNDSELKIKVSKNNNYIEGKVIKHKGKYMVMEAVEDATISKSIFNKINKFEDYKQIIKYFKIFNLHEILDLLNKFEIDFLTNVIDLIYFRDKMDMKEFLRLSTLFKSYAQLQTYSHTPTLKSLIDPNNMKIDYSYVKSFDFTLYDDSLMMLEVLKFDRKKHLDKIRDYDKLKEYHDKLVNYFNIVGDKEKNENFRNFVERFRFLESKENYDGPLEIKLISTPGMLMKEGADMKHSVASYAGRVASQKYLIGQVFDRSKDVEKDEIIRFTMAFEFDNLNGLEFDQVKGFANKQGSERFKKLMIEYLTAKDISFKPIKDLKLKN